MSRIKKGGAVFFLFVVMLCASMGIASAGSASAQPVSVVQEAAVVGGESPGCAFAAGLAVGLDVAGLFGCLPCAVGGAVVGIGTLIACT
jgi:hypothetical protein